MGNGATIEEAIRLLADALRRLGEMKTWSADVEGAYRQVADAAGLLVSWVEDHDDSPSHKPWPARHAV